jgi:hypothetical protein
MLNPNNFEDLQSIEKCRSILKEILNFGVSDLEIKKIIDFLSLELEDTSLMCNIQSALKNEKLVEKEEKIEFTI